MLRVWIKYLLLLLLLLLLSNFADEDCYIISALSKDFRSQRSCRAVEWAQLNFSSDLLAHVQRQVPNRISLLNLWILRCVGFWVLKKYLYHTDRVRPIWLAKYILTFDLQQCKMIYSFVDKSLDLHFMCIMQVYVSLYFDRCLNLSPWHSQELYFTKWKIKHSLRWLVLYVPWGLVIRQLQTA